MPLCEQEQADLYLASRVPRSACASGSPALVYSVMRSLISGSETIKISQTGERAKSKAVAFQVELRFAQSN